MPSPRLSQEEGIFFPLALFTLEKKKQKKKTLDRWLRVSAKFEFTYESLKRKFSLILFVYNLMIGYQWFCYK